MKFQGVKRRIFIFHYKGDRREVNAFIERFGELLIKTNYNL